MKMALKILLLLSLPLSMQGCGGNANADEGGDNQTNPPPANTTPVSYSIIHGNSILANGLSNSKGSKVLGAQETYESELLNYSTDEPKEIDFTKSRVLLLDMGSRNNGGYGLKVNTVKQLQKAVAVSVTLEAPGKGCMTTSVMTNPYIFVEVDSTDEILLQEELETFDCE